MCFGIRGITDASCMYHCIFLATGIKGPDRIRLAKSKGTREFVERDEFQRTPRERDSGTIHQGIARIAIG